MEHLMEPKSRNEKVKATVEVDGIEIINMENSIVYETIRKDEAYIYIATNLDPSTGGFRSIKIRFLKK